VSTKESFIVVAANPSGNHTHTDVPNWHELYIEENCPRLVSLG